MDIDRIEQLIHVVKGADVSELSLQSDSAKVSIKKGRSVKAASAKKTVREQARKASDAGEGTPSKLEPAVKEVMITAPMVGIFHSFNGFVHEGTSIKTGQVVGTIESMKLMNDVTADAGGTVAEVLVEDGMPVEYGQVLLRLICD